MKHTRYYVVVLFIAALLTITITTYSKAQISMTAGFGGKIIVEKTPGFFCTAQYGPITILPYNNAPAFPYYIRTTSRPAPKTGGHILGLYKKTGDMNTCVDAAGEPVRAFEITTYGTSSR